MGSHQIGVQRHKIQFTLLVMMALSAGGMMGTLRTVIPTIAESEFNVAQDSFFILTSFILAFGFVKAIMNFVAGALSETYGRKRMLLLGWCLSIPIPFTLYYAPNWTWVIIATVMLGLSQGFAWSMAQMMKLDLSKETERGMVLGLNEFSGYSGVALSGYLTAVCAEYFPAREVILMFGLSILVGAFLIIPFLKESKSSLSRLSHYEEHPNAHKWSTKKLFIKCSFLNKKLSSLNQAGLVEKFVDALIWVIYPVWLIREGFTLEKVGVLTAVYGLTWGVVQLFTGVLSDSLGRKNMILAGMMGCAISVGLMPIFPTFNGQLILAFTTGLSMATLYPALLAGVADWSHSIWKGKTIGIYRFWRDLGYGIGALLMATLASLSSQLDIVFYGVALALTLSSLEVLIRYKEFIPRPRYWRTVGESLKLLNQRKKVIVIDVRDEWEFQKGHIEEAINIPLDELIETGQEMDFDKDATYLLTCHKGRGRSKKASKVLNRLGLKAYWIFGGTDHWIKEEGDYRYSRSS